MKYRLEVTVNLADGEEDHSFAGLDGVRLIRQLTRFLIDYEGEASSFLFTVAVSEDK